MQSNFLADIQSQACQEKLVQQLELCHEMRRL